MEREKSASSIGRNSLTLTVPPSSHSASSPSTAGGGASQGKLWEVVAAYSQASDDLKGSYVICHVICYLSYLPQTNTACQIYFNPNRHVIHFLRWDLWG